MPHSRRSWSILSLMLVLSIAIAACSPEVVETIVEVERTVEVERVVEQTIEVERVVEVTPTPTGPQGTLVRALSTFPNSLDLPQCAERQASTTAWQLYDTLVWMNEDNEMEPALAESWEISDDGTEYIFHLRSDVTFHNGEPFTADAVVYSWERAAESDFEYADQWQEAELVERIDDYTLRITTAEPNALFFSILFDQWAIVPPGFDPENPVGTGPYKFVEWIKGDRIVMVANEDYWRGAPRIETLIFRPIPESSTRVAAIQTGEVDIVTRLSAEEAQRLVGHPNVKIITYPITRIFYIAFNNLTTGIGEPTEDARVRQAMNYAVDVDAIIDSIFDGHGKPAVGYVASSELGYGVVEPFGYDPDLALELLADAGYPDGFSMDMACPAGAYTYFEEVCEAVGGFLGEVGIDVQLDIMESGHYWTLEANKELPPLFGDSWSAHGGEAFRRLQGALMGWDAAYSSWEDEYIIDMLGQIPTTVDREERRAMYEELQVYMQENPPFIYLYEPVQFEAINTRVQNYRPRSFEGYYLFDTFVIEE